MLTVRGQQHSFSTHERMFLGKCQSFETENVSTWGGFEFQAFGFMPNALTIWAIRARHLLPHVFEYWPISSAGAHGIACYYKIWIESMPVSVRFGLGADTDLDWGPTRHCGIVIGISVDIMIYFFPIVSIEVNCHFAYFCKYTATLLPTNVGALFALCRDRCCYTKTNFSIYLRFTSPVLRQSCGCPSVSEITLKAVGKCIARIHIERI